MSEKQSAKSSGYSGSFNSPCNRGKSDPKLGEQFMESPEYFDSIIDPMKPRFIPVDIVAAYGWTLGRNEHDIYYRGIKIGDMDFRIGTLKANRETVDEYHDTPSKRPGRCIGFDRGTYQVLVFSYQSEY